MATTAGRAAAAALAVAAYVVLGSCAGGAPVEQPAPVPVPTPAPPAAAPPEAPAAEPPAAERPVPEPGGPEIRVGLVTAAPRATLGGGADLVVTDPAGSLLAVIPEGEVWRLAPSNPGVLLVSGSRTSAAEAVAVMARVPGQPVTVNGRAYRGAVDVLHDSDGLTVVNRLSMEDYLLGVVSAEMGRRSLAEHEALKAQAVVSRTYAHRNLRRWAAQGFDVAATVSDQVYSGVAAETPEGRDAVRATRGLVLTHGAAPIDAFFYSTCGGRTAEGTEVFRAADRPYLHSVYDVAEDGTAYCSTSPRYRWREEWTGEALRATLRQTLPTAAGIPVERVRTVTDVRVAYRTASGRVGRLAIRLGGNEVQIDGPSVRRVLRPASGELLRSNAFELSVSGAGQGVTRLVAEGRGMGHGVGFCQWGAVGRSRAGHDFRRILHAYYAGARIERLY